MFFFSPLEQFKLLPIIPMSGFGFDFTITNEVIVLSILCLVPISIMYFTTDKNGSFYIIPTRWQMILEIFYKFILTLVTENIKSEDNLKFFPLIFSTFLFILLLNLFGMIPYTFSVTSQFAVTFSLALSMFLGVNILGCYYQKSKIFSLFLPANSSLVLALFLVPIEFVAYLCRPIGLAVRLFANMTAGHVLMKVIAGFGYTLMQCGGVLFLFHYVPLIILFILFGLELAIAFIQAYVFTLLICMYINDVINLH